MTVAKFELALTRYRNTLKTVGNLTVKYLFQDFDAKEMYLHSKNRSVSFQKHVLFNHFQVFTRCRFQNVLVRVPISKSTVFEICRQKMCHFRVNGRPIHHIFHRFQNVLASCEHSLSYTARVLPLEQKTMTTPRHWIKNMQLNMPNNAVTKAIHERFDLMDTRVCFILDVGST